MCDRLWIGLRLDCSWIVAGLYGNLGRKRLGKVCAIGYGLDCDWIVAGLPQDFNWIGGDQGKDRLTGARLSGYRYAEVDHARLFRYLYEDVRPPKSGDEVKRSWALRTIAVSSS
jgi:hypothetical protein